MLPPCFKNVWQDLYLNLWNLWEKLWLCMFTSICIFATYIRVNSRNVCVCVTFAHSCEDSGNSWVFFLGDSCVRYGSDPHSCMSKPIFNHRPFMVFLSGLSDQTDRAAQFWTKLSEYSFYLKHRSFLLKQKHDLIALFCVTSTFQAMIVNMCRHTGIALLSRMYVQRTFRSKLF